MAAPKHPRGRRRRWWILVVVVTVVARSENRNEPSAWVRDIAATSPSVHRFAEGAVVVVDTFNLDTASLCRAASADAVCQTQHIDVRPPVKGGHQWDATVVRCAPSVSKCGAPLEVDSARRVASDDDAALCVPVVYGDRLKSALARPILDFFRHYDALGVRHTYVYTLSAADRVEWLDAVPRVAPGASVTRVALDAVDVSALWYNGQIWVINDCLHRAAADGFGHVISQDLDELLTFREADSVSRRTTTWADYWRSLDRRLREAESAGLARARGECPVAAPDERGERAPVFKNRDGAAARRAADVVTFASARDKFARHCDDDAAARCRAPAPRFPQLACHVPPEWPEARTRHCCLTWRGWRKHVSRARRVFHNTIHCERPSCFTNSVPPANDTRCDVFHENASAAWFRHFHHGPWDGDHCPKCLL